MKTPAQRWTAVAALMLSFAWVAPAAAQGLYCVGGLSDVGPDNFLVIRYSPSMQSPWRQDANLRNGDRVEVTGESGVFYRVRFQNRYEGWSAKRYIAPCRIERRAQPSFQAIPASFHGVWLISPGQNSQCRPDVDSDNVLKISARAMEYYESSCAPKTMRHASPDSFEAAMSCSGEGMTWDTMDHYSLHTIGGRRHLVIVNIRRTAARDETGKPAEERDLDKVVTSVAVECR